MELDVNTLFLVTIYVEAMLGLLLLFAWIQNSGIHAVAWWGCAHLLRAGSVVLFGMYGSVSDAISIDLANALLFTAFAVTWIGRARVRRAARRSRCIWSAARCCGCWSAASAVVRRTRWTRKVLLSLRHHHRLHLGHRLRVLARPQRAAGLALAGDLHAVRAWRAVPAAHAAVAMLPWSPTSQVFDSVWLTVLSFEALLFTIAIAFILLAMAKERTELRHKTAAMVDPLTGIANRRAFLRGHGAEQAPRG